MKSTSFLSIRRVSAFILLALGLATYQPGRAHSLAHPLVQPGPLLAVGLRVFITALPGTAVLRVRYESDDCGPVRLQLRDAQDQVIYSELKRQTRFAGDYILTSFPAGSYTLELQASGASYTQTVRLHQRPQLVATLAARPKEGGFFR